jgi:hypothetical protein
MCGFKNIVHCWVNIKHQRGIDARVKFKCPKHTPHRSKYQYAEFNLRNQELTSLDFLSPGSPQGFRPPEKLGRLSTTIARMLHPILSVNINQTGTHLFQQKGTWPPSIYKRQYCYNVITNWQNKSPAQQTCQVPFWNFQILPLFTFPCNFYLC